MTVATDQLIRPHGGVLVDRTGDRPEGVDGLEVIRLSPRELADLDMLASGALSPLTGFMARDDYERVVEEMHLASGLPWALPVCLAVDSSPSGDRVALADESGKLVAALGVEETFEYDKEREAEQCFRTTDDAHPGVARLYAQKPHYLAGRVTVFERTQPEFPEIARDPAETRRWIMAGHAGLAVQPAVWRADSDAGAGSWRCGVRGGRADSVARGDRGQVLAVTAPAAPVKVNSLLFEQEAGPCPGSRLEQLQHVVAALEVGDPSAAGADQVGVRLQVGVEPNGAFESQRPQQAVLDHHIQGRVDRRQSHRREAALQRFEDLGGGRMAVGQHFPRDR